MGGLMDKTDLMEKLVTTPDGSNILAFAAAVAVEAERYGIDKITQSTGVDVGGNAAEMVLNRIKQLKDQENVKTKNAIAPQNPVNPPHTAACKGD